MAASTPKKRQHRTMRGKYIDMENLRKKNELVPAVGNVNVNARGDELGFGGKIVKKREDVVKEHYRSAGMAIRDGDPSPSTEKDLSVKNSSSDNPSRRTRTSVKSKNTASQTTEPTPEPTPKPTSEPKKEDTGEWQEDKDGNFVKKEDAKK